MASTSPRTHRGINLGSEVREVLSGKTNSSSFTVNDDGHVIVTHESPAPRGLRHVYTRELEFLVRQMAQRIEDLTAQLKRAGVDTEKLGKDLEEAQTAKGTLERELEALKAEQESADKALRQRIAELGDQIKEAQSSSIVLNALWQLVSSLLEDEHRVTKLEPTEHGDSFKIGLDIIELHYKPVTYELTAYTTDGTPHQIHQQKIDLEGTQPTESGLQLLHLLDGAVDPDSHHDFTHRWSDDRYKRLFTTPRPYQTRQEPTPTVVHNTTAEANSTGTGSVTDPTESWTNGK